MQQKDRIVTDVEASPPGHLIHSWCGNTHLKWWHALCELFDNSFQYNATHAEFEVVKKRAVFSDNGDGTPNPGAIILPGQHEERAPGIGAYGIGGTEAILWIGGEGATVVVDSHHKGVLYSVSRNWREVVRTNRWGWTVEQSPSDGRGTRIEIQGLARELPHGQRLDDLVSQLGYIYHPAIVDGGKQLALRINGRVVTVTPWRVPRLEQSSLIQKTLEFSGNRRAELMVGMMARGVDDPREGIAYVYGHRVVKEAGHFGTMGFGTARVCGIVRLVGNWRLGKNKDDFVSNEDELEAAVFAAAKPVLEKAECDSIEEASDQLLRGVEQEMSTELFGKREKRDPPRDLDEEAHSRGNGKRKRKPKKFHVSGDGPFGSKVRALKIEKTRAALPNSAYGKCEIHRARAVVTLSLANPWVRDTIDNKNRLALKWCAFGLLAATYEQQRSAPGQVQLFRDGSSYAEYLGAIGKSEKSTDGASTSVAAAHTE